MIYLDNAASTACAEEVVESMLPFFRESFANASSVDHVLGLRAREAVDRAREQIAKLIGGNPEDVIYTSGATEANNLALSVALPVSTTRVEHPSILDSLISRRRDTDTFIDTDNEGIVHANALAKVTKQRPCLISVIATNNETGVEQDLDLLSSAANDSGSLLHIDATQAIGTRAIEMRRRGIAACSISAHKIYGPKGIGALVASSAMRRELRPILHGGGHERGMRSGTLNVPGIVGFGVAARLAGAHRAERRNKLEALRQRFLDALLVRVGERSLMTVTKATVSPHILSLHLVGVNARALLRALRDEVAFSLGSACATNKAEPSHVLLALGLDKRTIAETVRCSFSSEQSLDEVEEAAKAISAAMISLTEFSFPA